MMKNNIVLLRKEKIRTMFERFGFFLSEAVLIKKNPLQHIVD